MGYMLLMSSECILSRSSPALGLIPMIGLSARLSTQERMQGGETQGSTLTAVSLALNFARDHARRVMPVNMHMVFLSPGCILLNIELGFARMRLVAQGKYVSLLTSLRNCALCMPRQVQLCLHPGLCRLVLQTWHR